MTNNKEQSAVEWYIIKRDEIEMKIRLMLICANEYEQELTKADEQAKEMHKEEIMQSLNDGKAMVLSSLENKSLEQYYNETFGGGDK
jgi:hypothetical protein